MKLKSKKTGEIVEATDFNIMSDYNSLAELQREWEDYEEPEYYWYIDCDGEVYSSDRLVNFDLNRMSNIGNCFETLEEAEQAVEKLKAWKRLKDKGFEINDWAIADNYEIRLFGHYSRAGIKDELDLLFGGEE